MSRHLLFKLEGPYFPITINPAISIKDLYQEVLTNIKSRGDIKLKGRTLLPDHGSRELFCRYAILREETTLQDVQANAKGNNIILADTMRFLAFAHKHIHTEVTRDKSTPIVAADKNSTWFSHQTLSSAAMGLKWDQCHYATGPFLFPVSGLLKKGTRFLTICK